MFVLPDFVGIGRKKPSLYKYHYTTCASIPPLRYDNFFRQFFCRQAHFCFLLYNEENQYKGDFSMGENRREGIFIPCGDAFEKMEEIYAAMRETSSDGEDEHPEKEIRELFSESGKI
jgi:hypothetical protein